MCNKKLIQCDICANEFSLYTFFNYIFYSNNYIYQFDCGCYKNNKSCCFLKVDESLKFLCKECYQKVDKCPFCRKDNLEKKDIENAIREPTAVNSLAIVKEKNRKSKKWINCFLKYSGLNLIKSTNIYLTGCADCCLLINSVFQSLLLVFAWSIIFYTIPFFLCQRSEQTCISCIIISILNVICGWTYFIRLFGSIPDRNMATVSIVWSIIQSFIYFIVLANQSDCLIDISLIGIMFIFFILFTVCFCSTGIKNFD
jgi:hypothetical protein